MKKHFLALTFLLALVGVVTRSRFATNSASKWGGSIKEYGQAS